MIEKQDSTDFCPRISNRQSSIINHQSVGEAIVAEARTWIGTPFHHQGRLKGQACDCVGLIVMTLNAVINQQSTINNHQSGYPDPRDYGHSPDRSFALKMLREHLVQIPPNEAQPGDVIFFSDKDVHFGFISSINNQQSSMAFIHAYACAGKRVTENVLTDDWRRKICAVFRVSINNQQSTIINPKRSLE